ncbi:CDP-alcohol phosphatidyltransferase family protein [Candidatus Saccharibacteria bacterium]|nr:CDP-alcohol phosphatidyltransferase family protein [Candidatus Saccharibacteria bacterium]MBI3337983.1 CDP-alcohol phosphatidyltransferase family protein [Candidatus Saccharibacteria bacterium]
MSASDTDQQNVFQRVAEATNHWLTPANILDLGAFVLALGAAEKLDDPIGIAQAAVAFGIDGVDGTIARKTGTTSDKGEVIDAVGDKIKLGYYLLKIWGGGLAPKPIMVGIGMQNTANAIITAYDRVSNKTPKVHPDINGKRGILKQQLGLGLNVIGLNIEKSIR